MRMKPVPVALIAIAATLFAVFLTFNFMPSEKKIDRQLQRLYSTEDAQFRRSMGVLLGPPIIEGNKVEVLLNGDEIFPSMLKAIREAEHTITFETYIYWSESIGKEFSDALCERARAGVKVHVLLDFIGSMKMDNSAMDAMKAAGVKFERFHKPVWWKFTKLNNRTHRKVLVSMAKSALPAAWALPTSGAATARTRRTGATPISASRDRLWDRCRPYSLTIGRRQLASCSMVLTTSPRWPPRALMQRKCSAVRRAAAVKACC
jgi:cardiolipin synthase